jgi:hypothetical protein
MCRNIRLLHNFEPPTTDDEIRDAALQFIRKVSGVRAPSQADQAAFERAVAEVAVTTRTLLDSLNARGPARTREGEREKAKKKWTIREARMVTATKRI